MCQAFIGKNRATRDRQRCSRPSAYVVLNEDSAADRTHPGILPDRCWQHAVQKLRQLRRQGLQGFRCYYWSRKDKEWFRQLIFYD